jgi:hypothetical protein
VIATSGVLVEYLIFCRSTVLVALFLKETLDKYVISKYEEITGIRNVSTYKDEIRSPFVPTVLTLYSLASFNSNALNDVFTIWCWADRKNGGLELNPKKLATHLQCLSSVSDSTAKGLLDRLLKYPS